MPSIICADDDPMIQATLRKLLEGRGFEVRTCGNGAQVIAMYASRPADVMILDLCMPVMSGMAALQKLRSRTDTSKVPILVVSGLANETAIMESIDAGADDFVSKPINPEELMAKVLIAMKRRGVSNGNGGGPLTDGSLFAGRYRVIREIGTGGYGRIYGAEDITQEFKGDLALKVFDPPTLKNQTKNFLPTLLREASNLMNLEHANIIRMYDFGQSGQFYYMVMEFAEGQPLDSIVRKHGALPSDAVALIGYEVASALEYLQSQNIVHRDIKPDNIMITEQSELKIIDFGLAKHTGDRTLASSSDEFLGTAQFVSPEYIEGVADVDIRHDIYSLGITLYFAASGVSPFIADTPMSTLMRHIEYCPPPLYDLVPNISPDLSVLVTDMMARDREDRPSLTTIIQTLGALLVGEPDEEDEI